MSLADALIAIAVGTLILGGLLAIYFAYSNVFEIQTTYVEINTNAAIAINKISEIIRGADNIEIDETINSTLYTTDDDTLVLALPSYDGDDTIIADTYDYIALFVNPSNPTQLQSDIQSDPSSARSEGVALIAENLDSIQFNFDNTSVTNADSVEVILIESKSAGDSIQSITIQNSVTLRN